jgi:hypothetical protein
MANLILVGVPDGFPCFHAAMSALPAAREAGMTHIRVEKGHTCEFSVAELTILEAKARRGESLEAPLSLMGGRRQHEAWGNQFEQRLKVWPGFSG